MPERKSRTDLQSPFELDTTSGERWNICGLYRRSLSVLLSRNIGVPEGRNKKSFDLKSEGSVALE
jgi:hypothetical protein